MRTITYDYTQENHDIAGDEEKQSLPGLPHPRSIPNLEPESEITQEPEQPFGEGARDEIDSDLRHRMISEAAYHLYAERGYADGYDADDWQQAEAAVDHLLLKRGSSSER
jgi:hypothetical protein